MTVPRCEPSAWAHSTACVTTGRQTGERKSPTMRLLACRSHRLKAAANDINYGVLGGYGFKEIAWVDVLRTEPANYNHDESWPT